MLRKSYLKPVLFIFATLLLLISTPLYSQTSKISYRISTGFAHASLDEFWQSRFGDDWSERHEELEDNYFKPQAGLSIRYELNSDYSLLFGTEITKISVVRSGSFICSIVSCSGRRSINRNNFYFIPFNAGFEYTFHIEEESVMPFIGFGFAYTMGKLSQIQTNDVSDARDVTMFNESVYGLYLTLGFKGKLTDKFGLMLMGKYRNSDSIFGKWNNIDTVLNLSGFNLSVAVEVNR